MLSIYLHRKFPSLILGGSILRKPYKLLKSLNCMDKGRKISIIMFILGLIIALTSATLLFFGVISSGVSVVIGIIGIGLIASSNFRLLK